MADDTAENIASLVADVLLPQSAFIHDHDDDDIRYHVPEEVVRILAWMASNLVVPILVGLASSVVADRLKERREARRIKAMSLLNEGEVLAAMRTEVTAALDGAQSPERDEARLLVARASLADLLEINGWPRRLAERDSAVATERIHERLARRR